MSSFTLTTETPDEMLNRIAQTQATGEEEVDEEHVSFKMFRFYKAHGASRALSTSPGKELPPILVKVVN